MANNITRKLYKTTLTKDKIVHPTNLPSQPGAGKDEGYVNPVTWHFIDDKVYATLWSDYLSAYNAKNSDKFTLADDAAVKAVQDNYAAVIRDEKNNAVKEKYNESELAVPTDAIKTDIAAIQKVIDDKWSEVWNVS